MNEHYRQFSREFLGLPAKYETGRLFSEFLQMLVCALHPATLRGQPDPDNERAYLAAVARLDPDTVRKFPKLVGILMEAAATNEYPDILGEFFMEHVTHGRNGQFFTPQPICDMMAAIQGSGISGKSIADPAAGSGRMLLSFAKANPANTFYAADNSRDCALMCCINMFLNGLRGEVACMNSISLDWYAGWAIHGPVFGVLPIAQEHAYLYHHPPQPAPQPASPAPPPPDPPRPAFGGQLSIF